MKFLIASTRIVQLLYHKDKAHKTPEAHNTQDIRLKVHNSAKTIQCREKQKQQISQHRMHIVISAIHIMYMSVLIWCVCVCVRVCDVRAVVMNDMLFSPCPHRNSWV